MKKFITIKEKGDYDSILFAPEEDGLEIFMGSRGNGLEDLTDIDLSDISLAEVIIKKLDNRYYEFIPRDGPVRVNGGTVKVNGESYFAVFYAPSQDALFSDRIHNYEHLAPIGQLTDLETDGIRVKKAVTDQRIKVPLYEIRAEA